MKSLFGHIMPKSFKIVLFLIAVFALLLIAARPFQEGNPPAEGPLSVPVPLRLFLTASIGYLVSNGLKSFSQTLRKYKYLAWFPDLSGLSATVTAAAVTTLILFANTILSAVPADYVPIIRNAALLLGTIFSAFGIHYSLKGFQPGGTSRRADLPF